MKKVQNLIISYKIKNSVLSRKGEITMGCFQLNAMGRSQVAFFGGGVGWGCWLDGNLVLVRQFDCSTKDINQPLLH